MFSVEQKSREVRSEEFAVVRRLTAHPTSNAFVTITWAGEMYTREIIVNQMQLLVCMPTLGYMILNPADVCLADIRSTRIPTDQVLPYIKWKLQNLL